MEDTIAMRLLLLIYYYYSIIVVYIFILLLFYVYIFIYIIVFIGSLGGSIIGAIKGSMSQSTFSEAQKTAQKAAQEAQTVFMKQVRQLSLENDEAIRYVQKNLNTKTDLDLISKQMTDSRFKLGKNQGKNEDFNLFSDVENQDLFSADLESCEEVVDIDLISTIVEKINDAIS